MPEEGQTEFKGFVPDHVRAFKATLKRYEEATEERKKLSKAISGFRYKLREYLDEAKQSEVIGAGCIVTAVTTEPTVRIKRLKQAKKKKKASSVPRGAAAH